MRLSSLFAAVALAFTAAPALAAGSPSPAQGTMFGNVWNHIHPSADTQFNKEKQAIENQVASLVFEYDLYVKGDKDAEKNFPHADIEHIKKGFKEHYFNLVESTQGWQAFVATFKVFKVQAENAFKQIKEDQNEFHSYIPHMWSIMEDTYKTWNLENSPKHAAQYEKLHSRLAIIENLSQRSFDDMKEARNLFTTFADDWMKFATQVDEYTKRGETPPKGWIDSIPTITQQTYNYVASNPWANYFNTPTATASPPTDNNNNNNNNNKLRA